jgi:hypothetical protein
MERTAIIIDLVTIGKTRQEAWSDVTEYTAPYTGKADRSRMWTALNKKFGHRGSIAGSSWGACSVSIVNINEVEKTITWSLSYGIGD